MGEYGVGSVLRSTDIGHTWRWLNYNLPIDYPVDAVIRDSTTLYIGTRNGLYTSTNEGRTWNLSAAGATVHSFAICNGAVYYCGLSGEFKSTTDHGKSWKSAMSSAIPNTVSLNKLFADRGDLYIGTNGAGVFRTRDSGKTWAPIATNIPVSESYISSISKADTLLFISTIRNLYRSTDEGSTWNSSSTGFPSENGPSVVANNGGLLLAGVPGYGLYLSSDLGVTWTKSAQNSTSLIPNAFAVVHGTVIEGALGIYRSTDNAQTWEPSDDGVASTSITALAETNSGILAGDLDADFGLLWRTSDIGEHWESSATGLSTIGVNALAGCGSNILCATDGSGIFFSSDDGLTWNQSSGLTTEYIFNLASIGSIAIAGANGIPEALFRTTDAGVTWSPVSDQLPSGMIGSAIVDGTAFLVSVNGSGLFRSTDSGITWNSFTSPPADAPILIGQYTGNLFASDGGMNLYRSSDHGSTWHVVVSGIQGRRTYAVTEAGTLLFAGTDKGIYYSADSGLHWAKDTSDIQNFAVTSLRAFENSLYAGTTGGGVWTLSLAPSGIEKTKNIFQASLSTWPNPAKESFTFSYSTKVGSIILIRIIDENGRTLHQYDRGYELAGSHSFQIDCHSFPKGNYILQLVSGPESSSIKMQIE